MEEIWKDIKGYEGFYQVSNFGNVRSLNWANTGETRNMYLKPHNKGYLQVELAFVGKKKMFMVHRLVADAFINNPNGYLLINHKDENKKNNNVENLEWCTSSYNANYSLKLHGKPYGVGKPIRRRENGKRIGKAIVQYTKSNEVIRVWKDSRTIFLETGMSDWSISECCRGNRHTAYGYIWRYAD